MSKKFQSITIFIIICIAFVSILAGVGGKASAASWVDPENINTPQATTIVITSTFDDSGDGYSTTCLSATPCTLRRAINQAYGLSAGDRPVSIEFDIPTSDSGYNAPLGVWKIELAGTTSHDLRELNGGTTIDGSTQPGGRSVGPKIIVDGQENHNYGFILRNHNNQVQGLAMQNFKTAHISISSNNNLIADSWFGLSDDGTTLTSGSDDETTEGGSGVAISAGVDGNTIQDSVFAGFFGVAAAIRGDNAVFTGNYIGTRADGTVPVPAQFDQHPCLSGAWVGGAGITVEGNDHQIGGPNQADANIFAGIFLDISSTSTQPPAIDVSQSGEGHLIQNNIIGLDAAQNLIGVCGRGLDLSNGPQDLQVVINTFVETGLSAIVMNSSSLNGNTLRGNIIRRETQWPGEQGLNEFKEDAIAYGKEVPDALRNFKPAAVTEIDGVTVSGVSGKNSPCANCTVEVFLDDSDTITETLQSLAVVTADGSGNWTATLPTPLVGTQGLRTTSTVPDTFTIIGLDTGTTSRLSELYTDTKMIFLPLLLK